MRRHQRHPGAPRPTQAVLCEQVVLAPREQLAEKGHDIVPQMVVDTGQIFDGLETPTRARKIVGNKTGAHALRGLNGEEPPPKSVRCHAPTLRQRMGLVATLMHSSYMPEGTTGSGRACRKSTRHSATEYGQAVSGMGRPSSRASRIRSAWLPD